MKDTGALPGHREMTRPKHDVTEGIIKLADDKRPEDTLLIGLSKYALQRQTHTRYELTQHVLFWYTIGWTPIKSMTQAE